MSLEISRRSFLKYTAVAAVAVAGSSLLSGCNDEDKTTRTGFGELVALQNTANLSKATYANGNIAFDFSVKNGHTNTLQVASDCFEVTATHKGESKYYFRGHRDLDTLSIDSDLLNTALAEDATTKGKVLTKNTTLYSLAGLADGDTIVFTYRPNPAKYNKFYAQWTLRVSVDADGNLKIS